MAKMAIKALGSVAASPQQIHSRSRELTKSLSTALLNSSGFNFGSSSVSVTALLTGLSKSR